MGDLQKDWCGICSVMDHILVCYSEERIDHEGQVVDLLVNLPTQLRWLHLTRMPPGSFPDEFLSFFKSVSFLEEATG